MEKKIWSKPEMHEFAFAANEYVASSCGDSGKNYLFTCDAGGGASGKVWLETNQKDECQVMGGIDWIQTGDNWWEGHSESYEADDYLGSYYACGEKHETKNQNEFLNGWYKEDRTNVFIKVLVWLGVDKKDIHCTTNLDINTWEVAKS